LGVRYFTVLNSLVTGVSINTGESFLQDVAEQHDIVRNIQQIVCSVDRAYRYHRVWRNQIAAQLILSTFRQTLHVSGVSMSIIRRYNCLNTTIGTYCSF